MKADVLLLKRRRSIPAKGFRLRPRRSRAGIALIEVVVASALMLMVAVSVTHLLITSTRIASSNRVLTAARAVVQRNLDNALAVRWDSTYTPTILGLTTGQVYDDDGNLNGEAPDKVALLVEKKDNGTTYTIIEGSLLRIVTSEPTVPSIPGTEIRRITFRLTYTFQNRQQKVEMSSLRAIDD